MVTVPVQDMSLVQRHRTMDSTGMCSSKHPCAPHVKLSNLGMIQTKAPHVRLQLKLPIAHMLFMNRLDTYFWQQSETLKLVKT